MGPTIKKKPSMTTEAGHLPFLTGSTQRSCKPRPTGDIVCVGGSAPGTPASVGLHLPGDVTGSPTEQPLTTVLQKKARTPGLPMARTLALIRSGNLDSPFQLPSKNFRGKNVLRAHPPLALKGAQALPTSLLAPPKSRPIRS